MPTVGCRAGQKPQQAAPPTMNNTMKNSDEMVRINILLISILSYHLSYSVSVSRFNYFSILKTGKAFEFTFLLVGTDIKGEVCRKTKVTLELHACLKSEFPAMFSKKLQNVH